jgi:hypothetical protein
MGGMDVDDLYGLPLDRFVPERDAVVRALRADGRREAAADVAGLRKPSVAAWSVNQLVRTQGRAVAELFDAGDALREAQADVLAGRGDGRALRAAAEREHAAVDVLGKAARGLLTSEGREQSAAVIDRVADTMHAAAVDDDARGKVRDGRLERELHHTGLGVGEGRGADPVRHAAKRNAPTKETGAKERGTPALGVPGGVARKERAERQHIAPERAEAQRVERERAQAHKTARAAEVKARRLAERAARVLQIAEERRDRAAQTLRDADEALVTARGKAEAAAGAHRRAQQLYDNAERGTRTPTRGL